ncbi:MAG: NAD kinase [Burkholderiales bacterium]|nr:NAD kinase [Burkholderiales bacterium]
MSTPSAFPTVAIIGKHGDPPAVEDLLALARFLEGRGHRVVFESATATDLGRVASQSLTPQQIGEQAQLAIVVGGDGTMLGIARQLAPYRVPLIGVNQGRLGFMTDIPSDKMLPVLADMLDGKVESEQRSLLAGTVIRDGQPSFHGLAFNDVVVARGSGAGMIELRVTVDGQFMYNQRSDGLIVSTPTGSTAYALAAGGPILQPQLGGIVMVPIAPHALSNRPIVLSDDREIEIELSSGRDCSVNFDMQSVITLHVGDRVLLKRSSDVVTFLHPLGWNYFDTLREKLHWNEYPSTSGQLK